jgi:hydroxymethylbilane synthase
MAVDNHTQTITIGSRTSDLALWQTYHVRDRLQTIWPDLVIHIEPFVTRGDKTLDKPLPEIGGKGLFTLELEEALRDGRIQLAVHSLKDLPVENADGLTLGAIVGRADVRDVLVAQNGGTLKTLPHGAVIGTSSLRRQSQLLAIRPDLRIQSIRGNVSTRIRKVLDGEYDAAVLAAAGITRLGLDGHITEWLPLTTMLPAPGQGALAVQCRTDDAATLRLLQAVDQPEIRACVLAERSFLAHLAAGCSTPVAAYATRSGSDLHLTGVVGSPDGQTLIHLTESGQDAWALGKKLAQTALDQGAREILAYV